MKRISNIQLFSLIVVFQVGSTTLFALGIGAKQDAWIVILMAFVIGLSLLLVYTQFPKYCPNQNFSEILNNTIGTKLAKPLLLLFGLYFLSQATHNFYEFGMLINMTALPRTPLLVILYIFIIVIIYILNLGFEVLVRTVEILLPYLILFLIITLIVNIEPFEIDSLRPVLGDGLKPVLGELPTVIAFPFGEMVVFLMFWHYVKDQKSIRKMTFLAVSLSTLLLISSLIVMIGVLGPELTANTEIPLLETLISINIADIITNLDSIAVFIMFIGGIYKTALHFLGFILAMTWLVNGSNPKWSISIFGLLLPLFTVYRFSGLEDQRWKGMENGIYSILLFAFLPVLLLIIMFIKRKSSSRKVINDAN
ncbi:spore gernimation protein GerK [Salipaludibacillus neizhouensis]|uniref:Spore gernimation protein GerK n=1 Tax=Salipaludibacillus neizhouensis TaxID=885475 RepID=A0A3A9K6B3_9BACI|nr:GerAB/ArcD/ProY family transporter [Salipaludibacillus neizhouensis]RKL66958.1 spore gernimation protein GerK [Salipaludibacillus neizhouensis]